MIDLFSQEPLAEGSVERDGLKMRVTGPVSAVLAAMDLSIKQRDTAMTTVQVNAGAEFSRKAREHIVAYLKENGSASGEDLTDSCKAADIVPHNDKAFGPVYMSLSRAGVIEKDLSSPPGPRRKGHASGIAWRWKLKSQQP